MEIGSKYIKSFSIDNDYYLSDTQLLSIDDSNETDNVKRSLKKLLALSNHKFYKKLNWEKPKWRN